MQRRGLSVWDAARAAGINYNSLARFIDGRTGLQTEPLLAVLEVVGLRIVDADKPKPKAKAKKRIKT